MLTGRLTVPHGAEFSRSAHNEKKVTVASLRDVKWGGKESQKEINGWLDV